MTKYEFELLASIMTAFNRDKVAQVWPLEKISGVSGASPGWFLTALQPFCSYASIAGYSLEDSLVCLAVMGAADIGAKKAGWAMRELLIEIWVRGGNLGKYQGGGLLTVVDAIRADYGGVEWLGENISVRSVWAPLTVLFNSIEFDRWKGVFNAG